jgi:hypothetical protein
MPEDTPKYGTAHQRGRILVNLWAKGYRKEGKLLDPDDLDRCPEPMQLDLAIDYAELLAAEYARQPYQFEQEAAKSIRAALREHELITTMEDMVDEEA